jgi:D-arabinose 1-dehydrogenase-like Zn-dependent alcohol dehydrogenase
MRRMNIPPGATVGIQGLGGLGHLAIQFANNFGYRVVALSRDSQKEKFARELGAHEYIDASKGDTGEALQKLGGASLIISTAPNADVMTPLLKGLGMLGKLLILSGKFAVMKVRLPRAVLILFSSPWGCGSQHWYHGKARFHTDLSAKHS